ncbi:hypothetical protein [Oribacterium sp. oral taxon 078]|uniref:hypothetical protein n=1 Tax=Oribacterium sp. oral taxon 078 TaxID=652706 RepID=UPI0004117802|nr:hypothetical protein [Oribacterium sp. oral taxon 078]
MKSEKRKGSGAAVLAACLLLSAADQSAYGSQDFHRERGTSVETGIQRETGYSMEMEEDLPSSEADRDLLPASFSNIPMPRAALYASETETIDITGLADRDAVKAGIESALTAGKDVTVIGSKQGIHSLELSIPDQRRLVWKAKIESANPEDGEAILTVSGGSGSVFELAEGGAVADRSGNHDMSVCSFKDRLQVEITGGEISSASNHPELNVVDAADDVKLHMIGGRIDAEGGEKTGIYSSGDVVIEGGEIFSGSEDAAHCGKGISAKKVRISGGFLFGHGSSAEALVDAREGREIDGGALVAFDKYAEAGRTHYLKGSKRNLSVLPASAKAVWGAENGHSGIEINGSSGSCFRELPGMQIGELKGISLPENKVYDGSAASCTGTAHIEPAALPGGESIAIKYQKENEAGLLEEAPSDAGKYLVHAIISGAGAYSEDAITLGEFEIAKRPVRLLIEDRTMTAGQPLPSFGFRLEGQAAGHGSAEVFQQSPVLTTSTDGRTAGEFEITALSPLSYRENYRADGANAVVKGKLLVKAAENGNQNPGTAAPGGNGGQNPGTAAPDGNGSQNPGAAAPGGNGNQNPGTAAPDRNRNQNSGNGNAGSMAPGGGNPGNASETPGSVPKPNPPKEEESSKQRGGSSGGGSGRSSGGGSGRSSGGGSRSGGSSGKGSGSLRASASGRTGANGGSGSKGEWIQDQKGWWYRNPDRSYPKSSWLSLEYNGKKDWYYFNSEGYMQTGWQLISGKWYYLYEKTEGGRTKGSLAVSTVIGGYTVNSNGEWTA